MPSPTVEDYVKTLYVQERDASAGALVPMGQVAQAMGVVPGTATSMIKTLADAGLARYEPRAGVRLTANGRRLALHVLRRHRLVERLLVDVLGMDWSEVHEEAERLEHVVSDRVLVRIDAVLGHPTEDPHGDPIPSHRGTVAEAEGRPLHLCEGGERVQVVRIDDQDPAFLKMIARSGLRPGACVRVEAKDPLAEAVVVRTGPRKRPVSLGLRAAAKVWVRPAPP